MQRVNGWLDGMQHLVSGRSRQGTFEAFKEQELRAEGKGLLAMEKNGSCAEGVAVRD